MPPCAAPGAPTLTNLVGWAERQLSAGSLGEAGACADAALAIAPTHAHARYLRGGTRALAGRNAEARAASSARARPRTPHGLARA